MPRSPGETLILRDAIGLVIKKAVVCRRRRNIRKRVYPESKSIKVLVDVMDDAEKDGIHRELSNYIKNDWVDQVTRKYATHRLKEKYIARTELLKIKIEGLTGEQSKLEKGKQILGNRWKEPVAAEEQEVIPDEDNSEKKLFMVGYPEENSKDIFNLSEQSNSWKGLMDDLMEI